MGPRALRGHAVVARASPPSRQLEDGLPDRKKAGGWTRPTSLTDIIGARGLCPSVTRDGKYIVFMEQGGRYWADASFIEGMRKQALGL